MYRYYKISHEWAEKLGEAETAPRHPDGMHLVTPGVANKLIARLKEERGVNMLAEEAFNAIGAIGLSTAEVHASARGELRHDRISESAEEAEIAENADNSAGIAESEDNKENTGNR